MGRNDVTLENGDVYEVKANEVWYYLRQSLNDIETRIKVVDTPTDAIRLEDVDGAENREFELSWQEFEEDCRSGQCVPKSYVDRSLDFNEEGPEGFTYL